MARIHEDRHTCPCGIRHRGRQRVVTYQGAYDTRASVTLCQRHATEAGRLAREAAGMPAPGAVQHGAHWGDCPVCPEEED